MNGTVTGCGYGHQIYVYVLDAAGNALDQVVIGDTYNNPRHISGEKGPGHAQYDLHMNGFELLVVEDVRLGHGETVPFGSRRPRGENAARHRSGTLALR